MGFRKVFNPWVGYTTRSYSQIKNSVLTSVGTKVPELTDHSESNPLVIILSTFAGVAEMLGYYIDNMAAEAFIVTARRFSSAVKFTKLIDYRIKAANPASADLLISLKDGSGNTVAAGVDGTVPVGLIFSTDNGLQFISTKAVNYYAADESITIPVEQKVIDSALSLGITSGLADQAISIGTDYVDDSAVLTVDGDLYELVETFGFSGPNDKHYTIEISIDKIAYVRFGDGTNGIIPSAGLDIVVTLYRTSGADGMVDENTIVNLDSTWTKPGGWVPAEEEFTNPLATSGGTNYETLETIRRRAPLSLRTLDRAVTKQDYQDVAELHPGVSAACVFYECGKNVCIFIAPEGGGIAQTALLDSVLDFVNERKMVTTNVITKPAGITEVIFEVEAWGKFGIDAATIKTAIEEAILAEWTFNNSYINRPFRVSDITALIDNLTEVDYLNIDRISTVPYMRPVDHTTALVYTAEVIVPSTPAEELATDTKSEWHVTYLAGPDHFIITKDSISLGTFDPDVLHSSVGDVLDLQIDSASYNDGEEWTFTTYPINKNIEFDDHTVPVISLANLTVVSNEQLI